MFRWFLRFSIIAGLVLLAVLVGLASLSLNQAAVAASPLPARQPVIPPLAQVAGLSLAKTVFSDTVALGQPVTYTVSLKNEQTQATDFQVVDELPAGLSLQRTLFATIGISETAQNTLRWSGTLAAGEEATLSYVAIPPTTATPGQTLQNVAIVQAGDRTLQAAVSITTTPPNLGLWGRFVNAIAWVLVETDLAMKSAGLPYTFGFAIILFTVTVRLLTFPLNMQQIRSSKAMQELQPKMKELQEKYKNDREKLAQEQMALYRENGVNPLGGCLPLLVQMPVWFALYQSLIQLSHEGLLREGFFWIPSLAGPVANGSGGLEWLWPFIDGSPPLGWGDTIAYLALPVLLVVSQIYMQKMMTPPTTDPQQASMQAIMKYMPLMFGYFALIVPAGLTLYWFTSNILAMVQQYFTTTQLAETITQPKKKSAAAAASPSISENAPLPVNSSPSNATAAVSADEGGKSKNVKSKRKRRKR